MAPPGLAAVEAAKLRMAAGQAAYDSPSKASPPEDLLRALDKHARAKAFFAKLSKVNLYSDCLPSANGQAPLNSGKSA